ncbi:hypothetical protein Rsub_07806 [Raphidocelis subcapitata]|uniref:MLO-like protein n=1 Tax=Raphidocelis subcapitata TaxID=307507 RepID=A0A2V0P690_9CHLO|nr:hypothetical protein Rsub_07806 [Raphidocelis subcapitata]|eukprot:GBF95378.1 hypothetical protein Rsub_07806 [Raphidocelis subcapitata]
MAEEHHGNDELSMLESSPAVIAVIMVFFLLVTTGLDAALRATRRALRRRRKLGLLAAVNHLSSELMLLAVASLVLTAVEPRLEHLCLPTKGTMRPWLIHVHGCACCLTRTAGVSECFLRDRECPATFADQCHALEDQAHAVVGGGRLIDGTIDRLRHHNDTVAAAAGGGRALLQAGEAAGGGGGEGGAGAAAQCDGFARTVWPECGNREGYAPVVTSETVEQIHMFLFVVTCVHILVSAAVLLLSTLKLRVWRRMAGPDGADECVLRARAARRLLAAGLPLPADGDIELPAQLVRRVESRRAKGEGGGAAAGAAAGASGGAAEGAAVRTGAIQLADVEAGARGAVLAGGGGNAAAAGAASRRAQPPPPSSYAPSDGGSGSGEEEEEEEQEKNGGKRGAGGEGSEGGDSEGEGADWAAAEALSHHPTLRLYSSRHWAGRPERLQGAAAWLHEALFVFMRQFSALTVTAREYSVLRACFYFGHGEGLGDFQGEIFHPYLTECVERDGAAVVGLGLATWGAIIVFVLLSSAIGWCAWLFSVAAGVLLALVNTYLMTLVRYATRGGAVRVLVSPPSWRRVNAALLPLIKLLLFCCSFVVSNSLFFAAFFGPQSCFFSRTGFQRGNPVPFWVVMIADLGMALSLGLVTLPTYALLAHSATLSRGVYRQKRAASIARAAAEAAAARAVEGG